VGWWNKISCATGNFGVNVLSADKGLRELQWMYYRRNATPNEQIERHRIKWEQLISYLKSHMYKIKPNTLHPLKHVKKDINELQNINPRQRR